MTSENKTDLIGLIIAESQAYSSIENIETLLEEKQDFSSIPLQPLFVALKESNSNTIAQYLPKFSQEQRKALVHLDIWQKDNIDMAAFEYWLECYSKCGDIKVLTEFVLSSEFTLFLKGRFNIWTFDVDDPMYPDHDFYFLTEDSLLLFEYDEKLALANEVKNFLKILYAEWGVEKAYSYLFKMVSTPFMPVLEDEYELKKGLLRDFGFVDYYDALEINSTFPDMLSLNKFIETKKKATARIHLEGQMQALHRLSVIAYKKGLDSLQEELAKVNDLSRQEYLRFNFIRLVNGSLSLEDALRGTTSQMTDVGKKNKYNLLLGLSYLQKVFKEDAIFNVFDIIDVHKIGLSLLKIQSQEVKKRLKLIGQDDKELSFFGKLLEEFYERSELVPPRYTSIFDFKEKEVFQYDHYLDWLKHWELFEGIIPFIHEFFKVFSKLKDDGELQDNFYINFNVDDIDFECLILSNFVNDSLAINERKIGLKPQELLSFWELIVDNQEKGEIKNQASLYPMINKFSNKYGLAKVPHFENYLYYLLETHLSGYAMNSIAAEEYKHIGGVILLNM